MRSIAGDAQVEVSFANDRPGIAGERIRLPGQAMHHSVKKLLSSRVPPWQRAALPFVYNEQNELLAVGEVLISAQLDDLSRQHGLRLHWHSDSE